MKLANDLIKNKFDDVDEKIDFVIELYRTLQLENKELLLKIKDLETDLDNKNERVVTFSEQEELVQSKIDGLLKKLDDFSDSSTNDYQSNL